MHSESIRAVTQGVYVFNLCNILCYSKSVEIYCYVSYAVQEQPVIMCPYNYNHFGTNPVHLVNVKCCGAVPNVKCCGAVPNVKCCGAVPNVKCCRALPNEMSLSKNTELPYERKRVNSL